MFGYPAKMDVIPNHFVYSQLQSTSALAPVVSSASVFNGLTSVANRRHRHCSIERRLGQKRILVPLLSLFELSDLLCFHFLLGDAGPGAPEHESSAVTVQLSSEVLGSSGDTYHNSNWMRSLSRKWQSC